MLYWLKQEMSNLSQKLKIKTTIGLNMVWGGQVGDEGRTHFTGGVTMVDHSLISDMCETNHKLNMVGEM